MPEGAVSLYPVIAAIWEAMVRAPTGVELNEEKRNKIQERDAKKKTLDALSKVDPDKSIWGAIVSHRRSDEVLGIWAALKGYDAIECKNGNGSSNSFYVILNRSKLIISNEVDYI